jgi:hypothetical protein
MCRRKSLGPHKVRLAKDLVKKIREAGVWKKVEEHRKVFGDRDMEF